MKKLLKKTVAVVLTSAMALTVGIPAFAAIPFPENDGGAHKGQKAILEENVEPISQQELENIFENFAIEYNGIYENFTEDKYTEATTYIESAQRLGIIETDAIPYATDDYMTNEQKLRAGNYIETVLDLDEGLRESDVAAGIAYSVQAKNISSNAYPNDVNKQDAYRHFSWNFLMADNWTQQKARIIANNHEWGLVLLTPTINYYKERYDYYINSGYSDSSAANTAFLDATNYLPSLKYYTVKLCEGSLSSFKALFTNDNIMDFYNNCYGRAATVSYSSYASAFNAAWNDGDLIKSAKSVTNTHYNNVWSWDWYTY